MGKTKKSTLANVLIDELLSEETHDTKAGSSSSVSDFSPAETPGDLDLDLEGDAADLLLDLEAAEALLDNHSSFGLVAPVESENEALERSNTQPLTEKGTMPDSHSESNSYAEPLDEVSNPRAAVGRAEPFRSTGMANSTDMALAQSENLRLAQQRILDLEKELQRLREENEELGSAGETLRRRADELLSLNEELRRKIEHEVSTSNQEKDILKHSKDSFRKELEDLRQKNTELELRLSSNLQRVRVRERELENRLELMKVESKALVRSKDEMVLDLKRQMDQLNLELNNYRVKSQDLNKQINDRQEMLRRTVKALRLALSMLEGEEDSPALKKVK